jgi:hypothetical protein
MLLWEKSVSTTALLCAVCYYQETFLLQERKGMVCSPCCASRVRWLWAVILSVGLCGCSPAYHFHYQYAMVPQAGGTDEGIETNRVRVRVTPTDEAGVLHLLVMNVSAQPLTIVWSRTHYVDPLGQTRPVIDASATGLFSTANWPAEGTPVGPGEAFQGLIRPGGLRITRQPSLSPYAGQPDPRLPPDPAYQPTARPLERVSLNPFTVSRSSGGEVATSTSAQPLLPAGGSTPALGQAYKGREFRLILTLLSEAGVTPYTFTFRITDVDVQHGKASGS